MRRCVRAWGACASGGPSPTPPEKRRPRPGDEWHPDEVVVRIRGKVHHLWRAGDRHGTALDVLVRSRRDAEAARRFFEKLPKGSRYVPRAIVTDKLESYGAAER